MTPEQSKAISQASQSLGRKLVQVFPYLMTILAVLYWSYRLRLALPTDEYQVLEVVVAAVAVVGLVAIVVYRSWVRGPLGWIGSLIFLSWLIYAPPNTDVRQDQADFRLARDIEAFGVAAERAAICTGAEYDERRGLAGGMNARQLAECAAARKLIDDMLSRQNPRLIDGICAARSGWSSSNVSYVDFEPQQIVDACAE